MQGLARTAQLLHSPRLQAACNPFCPASFPLVPCPSPSLQELQLQDAMQEMQQRLESGGAVSMADLEASRQRIQALTLQAPGEDSSVSALLCSSTACFAGNGREGR